MHEKKEFYFKCGKCGSNLGIISNRYLPYCNRCESYFQEITKEEWKKLNENNGLEPLRR